MSRCIGCEFVARVLPPASGAQTSAAQSATGQTKRVPARVTETVDDTNRVALRGNVHPKARGEFDRGMVADSQPMSRILLLLQRSAEQEVGTAAVDERAASERLRELSRVADAGRLREEIWSRGRGRTGDHRLADLAGFQNIKVAKGKTVVEFSGNVGQVRKAFGTEIHKFVVSGNERQANVSDPQIPDGHQTCSGRNSFVAQFPRNPSGTKSLIHAHRRWEDDPPVHKQQRCVLCVSAE